MKRVNVALEPLCDEHREQFILDNQRAFKYGAVEEFGLRDDHIDGDGEIISRRTIEGCIDDPKTETYRIMCDGKYAGGVIISIDRETAHNHLDILFTLPEVHGKGIGTAAWQAIEALHPETVVWETCTPYFEKRNIHFYINKCGFYAVEFFCEYHADSEGGCPDDGPNEGPQEMLRFKKFMK